MLVGLAPDCRCFGHPSTLACASDARKTSTDADMSQVQQSEYANLSALQPPLGGIHMVKKLMLASILVAISSPVMAGEPDPVGDIVKAAEGIVMLPITLVDELSK